MRTSGTSRLLSLLLVLELSVCYSLSGPPCSAQQPKADEPPFHSFTQAWNADFNVVSARYDRANQTFTWVLEAKVDLVLRSYAAEMTDPDGVAIATVGVKFGANPTKLKKGTQVRAIISLANVAIGEVGILNIRERKPLRTEEKK
jgi:hypothetical protein